jgi:hypothetical protein
MSVVVSVIGQVYSLSILLPFPCMSTFQMRLHRPSREPKAIVVNYNYFELGKRANTGRIWIAYSLVQEAYK